MQASKTHLLMIGERLGMVFGGRPTTDQVLSAILAKTRDIHVALAWLYPSTATGVTPSDCKRRIDMLLAAGAAAKGLAATSEFTGAGGSSDSTASRPRRSRPPR